MCALLRSLPQCSVPQTRWVISRHGECTDTTGIRCRLLNASIASISALVSSIPTMTSTPSYPRREAASKPAVVDSGYTDDVDNEIEAGDVTVQASDVEQRFPQYRLDSPVEAPTPCIGSMPSRATRQR